MVRRGFAKLICSNPSTTISVEVVDSLSHESSESSGVITGVLRSVSASDDDLIDEHENILSDDMDEDLDILLIGRSHGAQETILKCAAVIRQISSAHDPGFHSVDLNHN